MSSQTELSWKNQLSSSPIRKIGFVLLVAFRFLSRGQNRFALLVSWLSLAGLILGVALLTLVVSVMSGFERELQTRLLSVVPHIRIISPGSDLDLAELTQKNKMLVSLHDYSLTSGAVRSLEGVRPVQIYGVDEKGLSVIEPVVDSLSEEVVERFFQVEAGLLLGRPLAQQLQLAIDQQVQMLVVESVDGNVRPKAWNYRLIGTFEVGAEPDYQLAIVNLRSQNTEHWRSFGEKGIELKLSSPADAPKVARSIRENNASLEVVTWTETYGQLFDAVRLEKSMMFLLLLLVVVIAAFNIVSGQMMLVSNKSSGIAILMTMGARKNLIKMIFLLQGVAIGLLGTILGISGGVLLANNVNSILDFLQMVSGMHLLDGSFFVEVPVLVSDFDLVVIAGISFLVCVLSSILPASRASRLNPKSALH